MLQHPSAHGGFLLLALLTITLMCHINNLYLGGALAGHGSMRGRRSSRSSEPDDALYGICQGKAHAASVNVNQLFPGRM